MIVSPFAGSIFCIILCTALLFHLDPIVSSLTPVTSTISFVPATSVADTVSAAERLRECFQSFIIMMIISSARINLACLKTAILLNLQYTRDNTLETQEHLTQLQQCPNSEADVMFLIQKNYLGYLNFELLKSIKPVLSDKTFDVKLNEYQSKQLIHKEQFPVHWECVSTFSQIISSLCYWFTRNDSGIGNTLGVQITVPVEGNSQQHCRMGRVHNNKGYRHQMCTHNLPDNAIHSAQDHPRPD